MQSYAVNKDQAGQTLAALLRQWLPGASWSEVRRLIAGGRVRLNGETWRDPARRLKQDDSVELLPRPEPSPRLEVVLRHVDEHIVVAEKPPGIPTVRHPAERHWNERRKTLTPTLEDLVVRQLAPAQGKRTARAPRLRIVHRLDKETSGLVVFARTVAAERGLGKQFHAHSVHRRYLAIISGPLETQTITSYLVRDRGDGRRGSSPIPGVGKKAVTHVEVVEKLKDSTLVACRLETGRTHQIRIHLAERGHPVYGDKVYNRRPGQAAEADVHEAPRLALHAAELGFQHPVTAQAVRWEMPLPADLQAFLERLRGAAVEPRRKERRRRGD